MSDSGRTAPTASGTSAEIRIERITKRFGADTALHPLDLVVKPGTLTTLLGPSGCGKTTLLRLIAGLETATSGQIRIDGVDVTALAARERPVSMVFQSYALFPHMTAAENVAYGLIASGDGRSEAANRAREALGAAGLAGLDARLPSELSGGQQQRVAVARALVLEPKVLLFDEPLSNLDARLRRQMRDEIRALQQRLGLTVVYVTHDQSEAMAMSDEIVVMRGGAIVQAGAPGRLYEAPDTVFVATFMGEANHVAVTIDAVKDGMAEIDLQGLRLTLPARGQRAGPADLIIRPEAIALSPAIDGGASGDGGLAGEVISSTHMGSHAERMVDTGIGRLLVTSGAPDGALGAGSKVIVRLGKRGVVLVAP